MAVYDGVLFESKYRIMVWMDPRRYRAVIFEAHYHKYIRTMLDKDRERLIERAKKWCKENKGA